ncbi:unnamed protein product [Arctia plantaginis]|uniref:CUB domain-containing protein n=1 Tax=Arctia plantaginis TaxID=874455 RepID=A0A8S1B6I3_ARCPL|nr:unnamed protein product [Arctia plantaginis]
MIFTTAFLLLFDLASSRLDQKDADCALRKVFTQKRVVHFANPHWPSHYRADTRCKWIFNCQEGHLCRLLCDTLGLPRSKNCAVDKLRVSDVNGSKKSAKIYCGQDVIDIVSNGTKITLELFTSRRSPGGRFKCSVQTASPLQARYLF